MLLTFLPGLIIGVTVHEAAHAWSAQLLGDGYARSMGRVTLNPLKHLSPIGTLALFVFGFGWGRPVQINPYNFKHPKLYFLLSSLAGPASNFLICIVCLVVMKFIPEKGLLTSLIMSTYMINGLLFVLNLIPIPPLDGSKLWIWMIPGFKINVSAKWALFWLSLVLILLVTDILSQVIFGVLTMLTTVLTKLIW